MLTPVQNQKLQQHVEHVELKTALEEGDLVGCVWLGVFILQKHDFGVH